MNGESRAVRVRELIAAGRVDSVVVRDLEAVSLAILSHFVSCQRCRTVALAWMVNSQVPPPHLLCSEQADRMIAYGESSFLVLTADGQLGPAVIR